MNSIASVYFELCLDNIESILPWSTGLPHCPLGRKKENYILREEYNSLGPSRLRKAFLVKTQMCIFPYLWLLLGEYYICLLSFFLYNILKDYIKDLECIVQNMKSQRIVVFMSFLYSNNSSILLISIYTVM